MSNNSTENTQDNLQQSTISFLLLVIGILTIISGVASFCLVLLASDDARRGFQNVLLVALIVGVPLTGLFFVAASAALDAVQETAYNTRAMRKIMSD